jgi:hypothetical protein
LEQARKRADLSGVNFDIGAMFKAKLNNKLNVYSSLNYTLENTLTSNRNIATVAYNSGFDLSAVDILAEQSSVVELKFQVRSL